MGHLMEVTCPPGVAEGDLISVEADGAFFDVALPAGVGEGEIFQIELPDPEPPELLPSLGVVAAHMSANAAGSDVLAEALRLLLDTLDDGAPALDELIDEHCDEFRGWEKGGEQQLHWGEIFNTYVATAEGVLTHALTNLGSSPEDVFAYAEAYEGTDERVRRLVSRLLAIADYDSFCTMMAERNDIKDMFE